MRNKLIALSFCLLFSVLSCKSQMMNREELIKKALSYYCGNNEDCIKSLELGYGNFVDGEFISFQPIDSVKLIKVFEVNRSHPSVDVIPITHSGNIIEGIELKEFNKLGFDDCLSAVDKSILYLIMNGNSINNFFSWELSDKSNKVTSELIDEMKRVSSEFSKHKYSVPHYEKGNSPSNFQIKLKGNRNRSTCFIYLTNNANREIQRKKFVFKNGFLTKVKGKVVHRY